jgi:hypothetical protein
MLRFGFALLLLIIAHLASLGIVSADQSLQVSLGISLVGFASPCQVLHSR